MHIPENYLSPVTCGVMGAAMLPVWTHSIKKVAKEMPKEKMPLLGVGAAFSFLSMMFNVPLIGGTTGHAVGGTLIALLFGPEASCIAVSIALLIQAVLFGDGGILALGANCFNMAFVLPFVGFYMYKLLMKLMGANSQEKSSAHYISAAIASYMGINVAALCASIEFGLQPMLFKDAAGNALYCPYDLSISIPGMMIPHLFVAGLVEAAFTVAVFAFVRKTSPDLIFENWTTDSVADKPKRHFPVYALLAALIAACPLGLLATGTAWGEWGADEIQGISQNGKALGYTPKGLAKGWSLDVLIPDYAVSGIGEVAGYIISAILGVAILVIVFKLASLPMKRKAD
ncbi:MAG: cobalt transporter CbiM [Lachnospiraceae bacterium]|nr:cobalt transporter CbiM [Lachnospiraceae bacterium]